MDLKKLAVPEKGAGLGRPERGLEEVSFGFKVLKGFFPVFSATGFFSGSKDSGFLNDDLSVRLFSPDLQNIEERCLNRRDFVVPITGQEISLPLKKKKTAAEDHKTRRIPS